MSDANGEIGSPVVSVGKKQPKVHQAPSLDAHPLLETLSY